MPDEQFHHIHRTGWLRAAVLGANDGIISNASLLIAIASAGAMRTDLLIAGIAGLVAGGMAMAAGEYVSVSSQSDLERADLVIEGRALRDDNTGELAELAAIYVKRGLDPRLASEVARQLMARDALAAHARDELGISEAYRARPLRAAAASGASFTTGAAIPLLVVIIVPPAPVVIPVAAAALASLAILGGLAAYIGGANVGRGAARVLLWGAIAMSLAAAIGVLTKTQI